MRPEEFMEEEEMPDDEGAEAMDAVLDDMGATAMKAKKGKYAGKPQLGSTPQPLAPSDEGNEASEESEMPSMEQLMSMLGG